ncbi:hypothetical protein H3H54_14500 [Brachybacterium sp. Z12]|uniref:putative rhamnosyl transferase n=1 Tax=Brachybacterium sp. Z12 TaxID=2759167 RepID=UPI00185F741C|nr:putative rhamnosyl transferase [Brachybacterium sp. Z12]QNN82267.1 hypothetical protein H3H54_14500 [Brachybacterium sp. Z12]
MFIGHTRFSLYQPGSTAWHASNRFATQDEYRDYLFSAERLDPRMDIFLSMALPQLDLAARNYELRHVVSYSTLLPLPYQRQLEAAAHKYPWLVLDKVALRSPHVDPMSYAQAGMVGSYRLDDDDILPTDYFDRVTPYLTEAFTGMLVSLAAGLTAIYRDGGLYFTRRAYVPMIAIGLLSIHRKYEDGSIDSPPAAAHNYSDRAAPVILDSRKPGYIWVRHIEQDTNVRSQHLSEEQRLKNLVTFMEERPAASDKAEVSEYFPVLQDRIHSGLEPGETLQVLVSDPTIVPPEGLPVEVDPIHGEVELIAKVRPDPAAVRRNVLLSLELRDQDENPVGPERADELRELGLSYSPRAGYYKYLRTEPGRFDTRLTFTLPDGVTLTGATARRWHRPETRVRIDELVLTSRA